MELKRGAKALPSIVRRRRQLVQDTMLPIGFKRISRVAIMDRGLPPEREPAELFHETANPLTGRPPAFSLKLAPRSVCVSATSVLFETACLESVVRRAAPKSHPGRGDFVHVSDQRPKNDWAGVLVLHTRLAARLRQNDRRWRFGFGGSDHRKDCHCGSVAARMALLRNRPPRPPSLDSTRR